LRYHGHENPNLMATSLSEWMSWESGVDLVAATAPGLPMPNVIVHVARLVHTPRGSAPSGMILLQPDPAGAPLVMGFVSTDAVNVGPYFGPKIFAGTPFAGAPVLPAWFDFAFTADTASATIRVAGHEIRTMLSGLGAAELVHRAPAAMTPFWQQGVERAAASAELWIDGKAVPLLLPPAGITGGPPAVSAPCGLYTR
jgi:hypothetical protein